MPLSFLLYDDRSADRGIVEERLSHSRGQSYATVGSGVGRDVTLVHCVAAAEKHRVRHARAVVMRAGRFGIFSHVDVGFHDVPEVIDVIAEHSRDVSRILRQDRIMAGRRPETWFASGNCLFADEMLALVEISVLLGDADDDFRRTGNAVAVPITHRRRSRSRRDRRGWPCLVFGATREEGQNNRGKKYSKERPASHWMRRVMRLVSSSTPKILQWLCKCRSPGAAKNCGPRTVLLAPALGS